MNIYEKYYLNDEMKEKLLKEAIIVFDTSALLDLYNYSEETQNEIISVVFSNLGNRLWIPSQVKFEFLKNRGLVREKPILTYKNLLKQQGKGDGGHLLKIKEGVDNKKKELTKEIKNQLKTLQEKTRDSKKHPYVNEDIFIKFTSEFDLFLEKFDKFCSVTDEFYNDFEKKINDKENEIKISIQNDKILEAVNQRFKVGEEYSFDKMIYLMKEGKIRYENQIPPGYEDAESKEGIRVYGDLFVWKQLLDYAKQKKKSVILVSNDVKPDWIDPEIKDTPRFELLKEFNSHTDYWFWSYNMSNFLFRINKIFTTKIKENTLEEVEEITLEKEEITFLEKEQELNEDNETKVFQESNEIKEAITNNFTDKVVIKDNISLDETLRMFKKPTIYLGENETGIEYIIAVNVIKSKNYANILHPLKNIFALKKHYNGSSKKYRYVLYLVVINENSITGVNEKLKMHTAKKLFNRKEIKIRVGYIEDGKFVLCNEN